jgi:hypothetical protein
VTVVINAFYCDCVVGYVPGGLNQNCSVNFDECGSTPCANMEAGTTCNDHVDDYTCLCGYGWDGEHCDQSINPCSRDELRDCDGSPNTPTNTDPDALPNTICEHIGPGLHTCTCRVGWQCNDPPPLGQCTGSVCDDIDECDSSPCQNGAACSDSNTNQAVQIDRYRCSCVEGFAGGACDYSPIPQYTAQCGILMGGNCDTDVYECVSSPCQNGAVCTDSSTNSSVSFHAYSCACQPGYTNGVCPYDFISEYSGWCSIFEGGNCDLDVDECASYPCLNGATCHDSTTDSENIAAHAYECTCAAGWQGFNCASDIDECLSHPCANGATCVESSINITCAQDAACVESSINGTDFVSLNAYSCWCVAGFANGLCYYDFISQYTDACTVLESHANAAYGGNCDIDVDECSSSPCQNDATCDDSVSNTALARHAYRCLCRPGWSGFNCAVDINECASEPCQNGAACFDSHNSSELSVDVYRCACVEGYANGLCAYDELPEYASLCNIVHSHMRQNVSSLGTCDIDVDECISDPCAHGAFCSESTVNGNVSAHAYRCDCAAGYANGRCTYDYVSNYSQFCNIMESSGSASGNCDVDVNECDSNPCHHGSACSDSTTVDDIPVHAYRCSCTPGFADGLCNYNYIDEYSALCQVYHSMNASVFAGNCAVDVNECDSSPCQHDSICTDSRSGNISVHAFRCGCAPGYANGLCMYSYIEQYVTECSVEESTWDGMWNGTCSIDVVECDSNPCQHGATCSDSSVGGSAIDAYHCACTVGWEGENCNMDINECASRPCMNGASCSESFSSKHANR